MTDREALKLALEALKQSQTKAPFGKGGVVYWEGVKIHEAAITAIEQALAQPAQKYEVVSGDRVPERMKYWVNLHSIQASEFTAFHIGFCCGEDSVQQSSFEREACAKVCEAEAAFSGSNGKKDAAASNCAAAIRARGET